MKKILFAIGQIPKKAGLCIIAIILTANIFAQVSFAPDKISGCAPLFVNFTNTSSLTGNIIWQWDWNDGSSWDNVFDTTHTFDKAGTYYVQLYAYDSTWTNLLGQYSKTISVNGAGQIEVSSDTVCKNATVGFWVYPNNDISSYEWNFGDGTTSTEEEPEHSYSVNGNKTVTLIVTTFSCGKDTITQNIVVTNSAIPDPNWWANNPSCPNDNIEFQTQDRYAATYKWYFGDGDSATGNRPSHSYNSPGNYPVTMVITNICGKTSSKTDTMRINNNVYFGNWYTFSAEPSTACPNDPISFRRQFSEVSQMKWYFGDGDSSSAHEPTHSYKTAGTYTVSLWLNNGCNHDTTITRTVIISNGLPLNNPQAMAMSSPACPNDNVFFQASSAVSYQWDFGDGTTSTEATPAHSYSVIDTYTVNVIMTNGCGNSASANTQVIIKNGVFPTLSEDNFGAPNDDAICPNDTTVFYSFGAASYLWDFGDGTSTSLTTPLDVNGITADIAKHAYTSLGTFTVKLTYTNGCGNSTTDSLTVTVDNSSSQVNGGFAPFSNPYSTCETVDFFAFGGATYIWNFGDGTSDTTTGGTISHQYSTAGNYTVSVEITNSCLNTATYSDAVQVNDMTATISSTNNVCNGASDGSIDLTVGGGEAPFSFSWSNGATTEDISNLSNGNYTVTITDKNGCSITASKNITQPSALNLTMSVANSTCSSSNGSASVAVSGGTAPYTYAWSNSSTNDTIIFLLAGNYTVTVTDAKGCTKTKTASVNDIGAPSLTVSSTNVNCNGENTGTAMVVASGYIGTKYVVTVNSSSFSPNSLMVNVGDTIQWVLGSGSHTTTSTSVPSGASTWDSPINGTTTSFTYVITVAGNYNYKCTPHGFTGTITASDPYSYAWSNTATTSNINNLGAGTYTVIVTDINSCVAAGSVNIAEPNALSLTESHIDVSCNGGNNGSINLAVSGGTSGYAYSWSNGKTTQDINNLIQGNYTVFVTDSKSCEDSLTINISEPSAIILTPSSTSSACGSATGSASVSVSGGTPSYTYSWSSGGSSNSIFNVAAGSYTVTVTDAKGCSQTTTINVSNTGAPALTSSATDATCNTYQDGAINLTVTGGAIPYSFSWSNLDTTEDISSLAAGIYTVTVTDNNNCSAIISDTVSEPAPLAKPVITNNNDTLSTVTIASNYFWNLNGDTINGATSQSYVATVSGTYSLTIYDNNGCSATSDTLAVIINGITEVLNENSLQIYPNPGAGDFILQGKMNSKENLEIIVTNIIGKEMLNFSMRNVNGIFKKEIPMKELTDGIYFLHIRAGDQNVVRKIVKQN